MSLEFLEFNSDILPTDSLSALALIASTWNITEVIQEDMNQWILRGNNISSIISTFRVRKYQKRLFVLIE